MYHKTANCPPLFHNYQEVLSRINYGVNFSSCHSLTRMKTQLFWLCEDFFGCKKFFCRDLSTGQATAAYSTERVRILCNTVQYT